MTRKLVVCFVFLCFAVLAFGQAKTNKKFINPTGGYELVSNAKIKNGETYGYSGDIQVELLDSSRIAISFYISKGMPSYNSGSFDDTLLYQNNIAIYKTEVDTTCKITFKFSIKGVAVEEKTANYNFGCGFGHAVVANGFYKKKVAKPPKNKDSLEE